MFAKTYDVRFGYPLSKLILYYLYDLDSFRQPNFFNNNMRRKEEEAHRVYRQLDLDLAPP